MLMTASIRLLPSGQPHYVTLWLESCAAPLQGSFEPKPVGILFQAYGASEVVPGYDEIR